MCARADRALEVGECPYFSRCRRYLESKNFPMQFFDLTHSLTCCFCDRCCLPVRGRILSVGDPPLPGVLPSRYLLQCYAQRQRCAVRRLGPFPCVPTCLGCDSVAVVALNAQTRFFLAGVVVLLSLLTLRGQTMLMLRPSIILLTMD